MHTCEFMWLGHGKAELRHRYPVFGMARSRPCDGPGGRDPAGLRCECGCSVIVCVCVYVAVGSEWIRCWCLSLFKIL